MVDKKEFELLVRNLKRRLQDKFMAHASGIASEVSEKDLMDLYDIVSEIAVLEAKTRLGMPKQDTLVSCNSFVVQYTNVFS